MKLKDKKGYARGNARSVAILVLVSMVMVLGVQLGVRSYAKSVSYSEAQVLCSTLTTTISDELRYSGTLKVDGSGNVTGFFSQQVRQRRLHRVYHYAGRACAAWRQGHSARKGVPLRY